MNNKPSNYNVEHEVNGVFSLFDGIRIGLINAEINVRGHGLAEIILITSCLNKSKLSPTMLIDRS